MIPNPGSQLIFRTATGLERAAADADAVRLIDTHAEAIRDIWDPYAIPLRLLPYLAWAMGVNYWDPDWSETTKRVWTARQWEFKSIRGTRAGFDMAIDFAGRDVSPFGYRVRSTVSPPQQVFSGPSLTRAQREAWLETLPQLRVWRIKERGIAGPGKSFYGASNSLRQHDARFCLGGAADDPKVRAITPTTALERLKRRARWIVNGQETDTRVSEFGSFWRVHIRSTAGEGVFTTRPIRPTRFFVPSTAAKRLVTIAPLGFQEWRGPIHAQLMPVSAQPDRVVIQGDRDHKTFSNTFMRAAQFYVPTDAWRRIFERYAINDGSLGPANRARPVQFMGVGRYGFPKYTAWVSASLRSKRSPFAAGEGMLLPKRKFWIPHDPRPVLRARAALMASKKLVDRVLLKVGPEARFVAGRPFIAGVDSFIVGQP